VEAKQVKLLLIGPDCSGKSTLAKQLAAHFKLPIFANRKAKEEIAALGKVVDFVIDWFSDYEAGFILDQWQFPVDIVYNRVLRGQGSIFEGVAKYLKEDMDRYKVLVIHLTANDTALEERFNKRGDELWDLKQIQAVAAAYKPILQELNLTHTTIDTSLLTPSEVFSIAVARISTFYGGEE
jgi:ribose 1,5-bisphosphokinase PhnN